MIKDLNYYILNIEKFIPDEICEKAVEELNNVPWRQHEFYDVRNGTSFPRSGSQEFDMSYNEIPSDQYLMSQIWNGLTLYIETRGAPWFSGWNGYSQIRHNKYSENRIMAEHCDHIHSLFDGQRKGVPILTILGCLNDDYEGGQLIMFENEEIKIGKGDLLIFPSNFLYPHRVEPVTKGVRHTYVSWAW